MRQRVQLRLRLAPVVIGLPVAGELLQRLQLHTLRPICDELLAGPARRDDAAAELGELLLRNVDAEGANLDCGLDRAIHEDARVGGSKTSTDLTLVGRA